MMVYLMSIPCEQKSIEALNKMLREDRLRLVLSKKDTGDEIIIQYTTSLADDEVPTSPHCLADGTVPENNDLLIKFLDILASHEPQITLDNSGEHIERTLNEVYHGVTVPKLTDSQTGSIIEHRPVLLQ